MMPVCMCARRWNNNNTSAPDTDRQRHTEQQMSIVFAGQSTCDCPKQQSKTRAPRCLCSKGETQPSFRQQLSALAAAEAATRTALSCAPVAMCVAGCFSRRAMVACSCCLVGRFSQRLNCTQTQMMKAEVATRNKEQTQSEFLVANQRQELHCTAARNMSWVASGVVLPRSTAVVLCCAVLWRATPSPLLLRGPCRP